MDQSKFFLIAGCLMIVVAIGNVYSLIHGWDVRDFGGKLSGIGYSLLAMLFSLYFLTMYNQQKKIQEAFGDLKELV